MLRFLPQQNISRHTARQQIYCCSNNLRVSPSNPTITEQQLEGEDSVGRGPGQPGLPRAKATCIAGHLWRPASDTAGLLQIITNLLQKNVSCKSPRYANVWRRNSHSHCYRSVYPTVRHVGGQTDPQELGPNGLLEKGCSSEYRRREAQPVSLEYQSLLLATCVCSLLPEPERTHRLVLERK